MPEMKDLPEDERERVWRDLGSDPPRPMVFANELTEAELARLRERINRNTKRLVDPHERDLRGELKARQEEEE